MKTINLDFNFKDLSGKEIAGDGNNAGRLLANLLVTETKGEAIKMYDWALALYNKKPIQVDDADFNKIKDYIQNSEKMTLLSKAQLLKYLETVKKK